MLCHSCTLIIETEMYRIKSYQSNNVKDLRAELASERTLSRDLREELKIRHETCNIIKDIAENYDRDLRMQLDHVRGKNKKMRGEIKNLQYRNKQLLKNNNRLIEKIKTLEDDEEDKVKCCDICG